MSQRCQKATSLRFKRAVSVLLIEMSTATPKIYCKPQWPNSEIRASLRGIVHIGTAKSVLAREDVIMRLSSGFVAPSVIAILSAANRRDITQFSQQRAKTHSPTRATWIAGKPKCSWAGTDNEPGGIAPACRLGGNFGSPQPIDGGSARESRLNSRQLNLGYRLSPDSPIEM
jgi:hypothetical protein